MLPPPSKIDRFFSKYGGKDKKYLCASEVEPVPMKDVLSLADESCQQDWDELTFCLNDPRGHPLLRQEIAKIHEVDAEDVMVAVPQELIYIAMNCLTDYLKGGDASFHAVVTFPTYQSLFEDLRTVGVNVSYWKAEFTDQGWDFNLETFKQQLREDTKLVVVNFPNNPTGFIPSEEVWADIISICHERDIFLFSDEMYRLSNNDGSPPLSSVCTAYERSMVLFGMSKTFGMPGLRMGWLCCKDSELKEKMHKFRDYISSSPAGVCELLATIALRNKETFLLRAQNIIQNNLKLLETFCNKHKDIFQWRAPRAGSTGFMRIHGWLLETTGSATAFCEALREETGILLLPASIYNYQDEFVRVGFGRANIGQYLEELETFLEVKKP